MAYRLYMLVLLSILAYLVGGPLPVLALVGGYILAGFIEKELTHQFMNNVRKEVGLAPLGRRERYNNKSLPMTKDAADLPPLRNEDRSWQ